MDENMLQSGRYRFDGERWVDINTNATTCRFAVIAELQSRAKQIFNGEYDYQH